MKSMVIVLLHGDTEWKLLCGPDVPHNDQNTVYRNIVDSGTTNEKFSRVEMHRVDDTTLVYKSVSFVTSEQAAKLELARKSHDQTMSKHNDMAEDREKLLKESLAKTESETRAANVARINQLHDSHRNGYQPKKVEPVAVRIAATEDWREQFPAKLRDDGPTLEEWIERGYNKENYPPEGYAVRPSVPKQVTKSDAELALESAEAELLIKSNAGGPPPRKVTE